MRARVSTIRAFELIEQSEIGESEDVRLVRGNTWVDVQAMRECCEGQEGTRRKG